ncbi:MAG: hypothetical protein P8N43_10575, partial [Alphaproteobacteria bacterium]|nr:hypothetical protein [Alphaproteobacteria bacterium]
DPKYQNNDHRDAINHFPKDPSGPVPALSGTSQDTDAVLAIKRFRSLSISFPFTRAGTVAAREDRREAPPRDQADAHARAGDLLA